MANPDPDNLPTKCPICKRPVPVPAHGTSRADLGSYPFCTDRCKLIDLGRWLDGAYQIPVEEPDEDTPPPIPPSSDLTRRRRLFE